MRDGFKNISKLFLDNGKKIIVVLGALGIVLIFLSSFFEKEEKPIENENTASLSDTAAFEESLKEKLSNMVAAITGSGKVSVTVTLEKSFEYIYAANEKEKESSYVILKDKSGTQNLVSITETLPKVQGVVIVCEKGGSPIIKKAVTDAVTTALGISSSRVCVLNLN